MGLTLLPIYVPKALAGNQVTYLLRILAWLQPDTPGDACSFCFCVQDPELQCLLLSDGKSSLHPSHIVVLPGDSSGSMAAISFTGALRIPVSLHTAGERWAVGSLPENGKFAGEGWPVCSWVRLSCPVLAVWLVTLG